MMNRCAAAFLIAGVMLWLPIRALAQPASAQEQAAVDTVKKFVDAETKEDAATVGALLDGDIMGSRLFGQDWKKLSDQERADLATKIVTNFRRRLIDLPQARQAHKTQKRAEISLASLLDDEAIVWAPHVINGTNDHWQVMLHKVGNDWKVVDFGGDAGWQVAGRKLEYQQVRDRLSPADWIDYESANIERAIVKSGVAIVGEERPEDAAGAEAAQAFLSAVIAKDRDKAKDLMDFAGMANLIYGSDLKQEDYDEQQAAYQKLGERVIWTLFDLKETRRLLDNQQIIGVTTHMRQGDAVTFEVTLQGETKRDWWITAHPQSTGWKVIDYGLANRTEVSTGRKNYESLRSRFTPTQCIRLDWITMRSLIEDRARAANPNDPKWQQPLVRFDPAGEVAQDFVKGVIAGDADEIRRVTAPEETARQIFGSDVTGFSADDMLKLGNDVVARIIREVGADSWRKILRDQRLVYVEPWATQQHGCRYYVSTWNSKIGAMLWTVTLNLYDTRWRVIDFAVGKQTNDEQLAAQYKTSSISPVQWVTSDMKSPTTAVAATQPAAPAAPEQPAAASHESTKEFATAPDLVLAYHKLVQSGKPEEALRKFWDMDRLLATAFSDDYTTEPDGQKQKDQATVFDYMKAVLSSPLIREKFGQGQLTIVDAYDLSEGRSVVVARMEGSDYKSTSRFYLYKSPDGLKIYDASLQGAPISDGLQREYLHGGPKQTFEEVIQKARKDLGQ